MVKMFLVNCNYIGCYECGNSGSHTIGICTDYEIAKRLADKHAKENAHHNHSYLVEIYEVDINKYIDLNKHKIIYYKENKRGGLQI